MLTNRSGLPSTSSLVLGTGKLFFDKLVDGHYTGFRHIGNCSELKLEPKASTVSRKRTMNNLLYKAETAVTELSANLSFKFEEMNSHNLSVFFLGQEATINKTTAGFVVPSWVPAESVNPGSLYLVYKDGERVMDLSGVSIESEGLPLTSLIEGTDFTLDKVYGMIHLVDSPAVNLVKSSGQSLQLTVAANPAARNITTIRGGKAPLITGRLLFIATSGLEADFLFHKVFLSPKNKLSLLDDKWLEGEIEASCMPDTSMSDSPYFTVSSIENII